MLNPRYEYQRREAKLEVAIELLKIHSIEEVAELTKLPVGDIKELL